VASHEAGMREGGILIFYRNKRNREKNKRKK
jgi:hypothetical protein